MARSTLSANRKFRRLTTVLGSDLIARGALEFLWESGYIAASDYIGDSVDVESAAHWSGTPGVLTQALLEAGGTDDFGFIAEYEDRPGCFYIHDFWDHAPDFVKKKHQREAKRERVGKSISEYRRDAALRSHESRRKKSPQSASGVQTADGCIENDANVSNWSANVSLRDGMGEEEVSSSLRSEDPSSPLTPQADGEAADSVPAGRRPRAPRKQQAPPKPPTLSLAISDEMAQASNAILDACPRKDADNRVIRVDPGLLVQRLEEILALGMQDMDLSLLQCAWKAYLASNPKQTKAPQYFFGKAENQKSPEHAANWYPWCRLVYRKLHPKPAPVPPEASSTSAPAAATA